MQAISAPSTNDSTTYKTGVKTVRNAISLFYTSHDYVCAFWFMNAAGVEDESTAHILDIL